MTWTYAVSSFDTTTTAGARNAVRLLVGDTDTNDQLVQDEEIAFALSEKGDNVYYAAAWICNAIATKFGRYVDTQLDGALESKYSQRVEHYKQLALTLTAQGKATSGTALNVFAGGISVADIESNRRLSDRPVSPIYEGQFDIDAPVYLLDY